MSERKDDRRIKELKGERYSFSKLETINHCLYSAYLTYRKGLKEKENIYAFLGTITHDTLEQIVNGKATEEDLYSNIVEGVDNAELLGYYFPKDHKGGDSIKDGWLADMTNFAKTYISPKGDNLTTESLVIYKTDNGHNLIGYVDLIKQDEDGIYIYDYKTSSMYKGSDLKEYGRQLLIYALGMMQEGFKVKGVAWIFLKYVKVEYNGYKTSRSKKKTNVVKIIERRKLFDELADNVRQDLVDTGKDELEINFIMDEFHKTNIIPDVLKDKYKVETYVCNYDLTDENIEECKKYIDNTIYKWENCTEFPPLKFTKVLKNGKEKPDTFFCQSLCGYFNVCPYIHEFLSTKDNDEEDDDDLF